MNIFLSLTFSVYCFLFLQITNDIKGSWVISGYQTYGDAGMTYDIAEMSIGDTINIGEKIYLSIEENEFTKAMGITSEQCPLKVLESNKIENVENHFTQKFNIKPIVIGIKSDLDEIYMIKTDCKNDMFKQIILNKKKRRLYLYEQGIIYILNPC